MADEVKSERVPFWDAGTERAWFLSNVQMGFPNPWESVELAGVRLPGICRVRSAKGRKLLVSSAAGAEAARLTDLGAESSQVTITCQMWTPAHLTAFDSFYRKVSEWWEQPDGGALDVSHPGLNMMGISSLYVTFVTVPEPGSVRGTYEATIQAQDYKPQAKVETGPKPVTASATAIPTAIPMGEAPSATEAGP